MPVKDILADDSEWSGFSDDEAVGNDSDSNNSSETELHIEIDRLIAEIESLKARSWRKTRKQFARHGKAIPCEHCVVILHQDVKGVSRLALLETD